MAPTVFLAVLFGAALHAGWNAVVKSGPDKLMTTVLLAAVSGLVGLAALPFLEQPAAAAIPYLLASAVVQVLYFTLVAAAYRATDMSRAYPLMRGLAPALVAVFAAAALGEHLGPLAWAGVALISSGVFAMTFGHSGPTSRLGTALALANAVVIACYTLIDGAGVRVSGAPVAYAMWLFLLNAVPLVAWALLARRRAFLAYAERHWRLGLAGGVGNLGSYGLALWAMTYAPVAVVAALRETSILFGMAIASLALHERIGPARLAAAALIVAGAASLRLA
ncbi:EamA family transporter [Amaricoccus sp.]|uniref:EamA family transporter n=1 Tax=Amaricoccus sp. TaxID=1872485 RepID=UPI001B6D1535|nr:EamA family transporter [Amaricoccus sp.]MBP7240523.1 EamA family transporter [Amaricoccus sp.]